MSAHKKPQPPLVLTPLGETVKEFLTAACVMVIIGCAIACAVMFQ